jgi:hypothetical protein
LLLKFVLFSLVCNFLFDWFVCFWLSLHSFMSVLCCLLCFLILLLFCIVFAICFSLLLLLLLFKVAGLS